MGLINSLPKDKILDWSILKAFADEEINITEICLENTVFLLINTPGAMQNIDREPLFCTQFAKQKVCLIVYAVQVL